MHNSLTVRRTIYKPFRNQSQNNFLQKKIPTLSCHSDEGQTNNCFTKNQRSAEQSLIDISEQAQIEESIQFGFRRYFNETLENKPAYKPDDSQPSSQAYKTIPNILSKDVPIEDWGARKRHYTQEQPRRSVLPKRSVWNEAKEVMKIRRLDIASPLRSNIKSHYANPHRTRLPIAMTIDVSRNQNNEREQLFNLSKYEFMDMSAMSTPKRINAPQASTFSFLKKLNGPKPLDHLSILPSKAQAFERTSAMATPNLFNTTYSPSFRVQKARAVAITLAKHVNFL